MMSRNTRVQTVWNALGNAYGAEWAKIGGKRRAKIAYAVVDIADIMVAVALERVVTGTDIEEAE